jgi:integral membrane protein (TIGR01906 family)
MLHENVDVARGVRPKLALALSALIVAAVPAILIGNTLWVLMNPWFVHAEYSVPGFPADSHGLSDQERTDLAVTGIRSIRPGSDGVELLREARLPSGDPAFEEREIQHMGDVRALVGGLLTVWAIALVLAVAAVLGLRRLGAPGSVGRALVTGAFLTVAAMALAGLIMLINFEFFFDGFHGVFFEGDTWQFDSSFLLRQLYPDFFWGVAGGTMAALVMLQAVALVAGFRQRGGDDRRLEHATPVGVRDAG